MIERNSKGQFLKGGNLGNQNARGNKPNKTSFKKGEHPSIATEFKKGRIEPRGENNPMWKGNNAKKNPKHRWIDRKLGKAKNYKCIICGKQAYGWSNKDHTYTRNLEDYQPLCCSCHLKWDYKYNNRGKKNDK